MKTCKSCKFWEKPSSRIEINLQTQRFCNHSKIFDGFPNENVKDIACFIEGFDNLYLLTGENFGCIHHEEKDNDLLDDK